VVGIFGHQNLGDGGLGWQAALDQSRWRRGLHDSALAKYAFWEGVLDQLCLRLSSGRIERIEQMNLETYYIITAPRSSALMSYGTFLQNAEKIASILDTLIQSDPEIADRSLSLKRTSESYDLCGDLLREHALKMVRALFESEGTTFTETNCAFAETLCILAGCGILVPVPNRCYLGLAAPEVLPTAIVKQSVLRLLGTATIETHPEQIIPAIGRESLFDTLQDLGALIDQSVNANSKKANHLADPESI
jgi:hypothetical protein